MVSVLFVIVLIPLVKTKAEYDVTFHPGQRVPFEVPSESCPNGYVDVRSQTHLVFTDTLRATRNLTSVFRDNRLQCKNSVSCSDRLAQVYLAFCLNKANGSSSVEFECKAFFNGQNYFCGSWHVNCEVYPPMETCILSGSCILAYTPIEATEIFGTGLGRISLICSIALLTCFGLSGARLIFCKFRENIKKEKKPSRTDPMSLSNLALSREAAKLNLYVQSFPSAGPYSSDKASPVNAETQHIVEMG